MVNFDAHSFSAALWAGQSPHFLKLLFLSHTVRYVANGVNGEMLHATQFVFQLCERFQLCLPLGYFVTQTALLLIEDGLNDRPGVLLGEQFPDGVDGDVEVAQEAYDAKLAYILLTIQSSSALAQLTGDKNISGIVVLYRANRYTAEFGNFSHYVF